jgi:hypothetical protein
MGVYTEVHKSEPEGEMTELPAGLYHILMWNYKDEVSAEDRAFFENVLLELPARIPSLISVRRGPVVGGRNQSFSHCFIMLFADKAGLEEYTTHPAHIKFAVPFRAACEVQVVADVEL